MAPPIKQPVVMLKIAVPYLLASKVGDELRKNGVFAVIVASGILGAAGVSMANDWTSEINRDELTDEPRFTVGKPAETGEGAIGRPPFMLVQCKGKILAIIFDVGITGIADTVTVDYRFDKNPPMSADFQVVQPSGLVLLGKAAQKFLISARKSDSVYFRAALPIDKTVDGRFDLSGLGPKFDDSERICAL